MARPTCSLMVMKAGATGLSNDSSGAPTTIESELTGYDACFFCLGVSSVGMDEATFMGGLVAPMPRHPGLRLPPREAAPPRAAPALAVGGFAVRRTPASA